MTLSEEYRVDGYNQVADRYSFASSGIKSRAERLRSGKFEADKELDYATGLRDLFDTYGQSEVETTAATLHQQLIELINSIGKEPDIYSRSRAWVYHDLAKQLAMTKDPSSQDTIHYRYADPMQDQEIQQEIVDRHFGWELYAGGQGKDMIEGTDPLWDDLATIIGSANQSVRDEIMDLMNTTPNTISGGRQDLPSYKLARLGELVRSLL